MTDMLLEHPAPEQYLLKTTLLSGEHGPQKMKNLL